MRHTQQAFFTTCLMYLVFFRIFFSIIHLLFLTHLLFPTYWSIVIYKNTIYFADFWKHVEQILKTNAFLIGNFLSSAKCFCLALLHVICICYMLLVLPATTRFLIVILLVIVIFIFIWAVGIHIFTLILFDDDHF